MQTVSPTFWSSSLYLASVLLLCSTFCKLLNVE
jgi:hypothetical protein